MMTIPTAVVVVVVLSMSILLGTFLAVLATKVSQRTAFAVAAGLFVACWAGIFAIARP